MGLEFGLRLSPGSPAADDSPEGISSTSQPGIFETITEGIIDTPKNAVKALITRQSSACCLSKQTKISKGRF